MKQYFKKGVLVACCLSLSACGLVGGSDDEPTNVTLNVTSNNQDAGSVSISPEAEEYESGDEITVEASPYNGFGFVEWSGDISSTDNPLTFTIEENTELVGNFEATSSSYEVAMSVTDTTDNRPLDDLEFGQTIGSSDGVANEDYVAPPSPPQEELHAYFENDEDLFHDYRSTTASNLTWTLRLQPGQTDSLYFSWSINETMLNGSLILRNADSSIEVDMTQETELGIQTSEADHLLIEYVLGGN